VVTYDSDAPVDRTLLARLEGDRYTVDNLAIAYIDNGRSREARFDLRWRPLALETTPPEFLAEFAGHNGIRTLHWNFGTR
jgi:hypothetical protein